MEGRETAGGGNWQDLTTPRTKPFTKVRIILIWCYLGWSRFADRLSLLLRISGILSLFKASFRKPQGPHTHRIVTPRNVTEPGIAKASHLLSATPETTSGSRTPTPPYAAHLGRCLNDHCITERSCGPAGLRCLWRQTWEGGDRA